MKWVRAMALVAVGVLSIAMPAFMAWNASAEIPTMHLDGAFQTFSGLQRLAAGQVPGADFFTYLGAGPLVLLFPVFIVAGGDLADSVFAASFVTLLAFEVAVFVALVLALGRRRWRLAVLVPPLMMVVVWVLIPRYWVQFPLLTAMTLPGNSLRPIRGLAPYLLALFSLLIVATGWRPRNVLLIVGVGAGAVGATWSNDYGAVSMVVWLVGITAYAIRAREWRWTDVLGAWLSALIGFVVVGMIVTRGSFAQYLGYAFIDVRGDQYWYFGPWSDEQRVFGMADLVRALQLEQAILPTVWLIGLCAFTVWKRDLSRGVLAAIGASLFLGGSVSTIGGHVGYYFQPFTAWAAVSVFAVVVAGLVRGLRAAAGRRVAREAVTWLAVGVVLLASVAGWRMYREALSHRLSLAGDPRFVYSPELAGYVEVAWVDHLKRTSELDDVVEEYVGLATAINGPNKTLMVDAVIHALGRQRGVFEDRMAQRPENVVTTAPEYNVWATWGLSANWWFYRDLFAGYDPEMTSPSTLVWTRTQAVPWKSVGCRIEESAVVVEAPSAGLYEVTLDYVGPGRGARAFSMVRNNISRPPMQPEGLLALDPGASSQSFPVSAGSAGDLTLEVVDRPVGDQPLTNLRSCSAREVSVPANSQALRLYGPIIKGTGGS